MRIKLCKLFCLKCFIFHSCICCSDLTMEIVRYRLIGPQSHSVLAETLEAATDCDVRIMVFASLWNIFAIHSEELCFIIFEFFFAFKEINKSQPSSLWWPEHCKDKTKMNLHQQQADVYHILKGLLLFIFSVWINISSFLLQCTSCHLIGCFMNVYLTMTV